MSFGNLAGPVSAGALLDAFGGTDQGAGPYKPAIVSRNGIIWLMSSILWEPLPLLRPLPSPRSVSVRVAASGARSEQLRGTGCWSQELGYRS